MLPSGAAPLTACESGKNFNRKRTLGLVLTRSRASPGRHNSQGTAPLIEWIFIIIQAIKSSKVDKFFTRNLVHLDTFFSDKFSFVKEQNVT